MKKYVKPAVNVETFKANQAIAACGDAADTYASITVNCVISGTHEVYGTNCGSNIDDMIAVTYNNQYYVLWQEVNSSTRPGGYSRPDNRLLNAIVAAAGQTIDSYNSQGWHAAPVTQVVYSDANNS